ncbi:MAG: galactose mutarotase [Rhodobacteraceae bacterium]|nr:galactose mutarotase [Paracoccaceae bacterium]
MTVFGTTAKGETVEKITIAAGDLTVSILTWGAVIQSVRLAGVDHDLTQGSDNIADYEGAMRYHGSLCGPVANRISNAKAVINGMTYELERNLNGRIFLHSGKQATHLQNWTIDSVSESSATLKIALPDGMNGLPGNRTIRATFEVSAPANLKMTLVGTTDETTIMNIANHSYWNFDGTERWDGHEIKVAADRFLPATPEFYPTGEIVPVEGTEMDFRNLRQIAVNNPEFDNNFCVADTRRELTDVVWLRGKSGVGMVMATTEPGIQVYDGRHAIRPGHAAYEGLAIEAQFWPDATNNPGFPSILLNSDSEYRQITEWRFSSNLDI